MSRHLDYLPLDGIVRAARNPKAHDSQGIRRSLVRFGFTSPLLLDERTGRLVAGHGRLDVLIVLREQGDPPPSGVRVGADGEWLAPVMRGWSSRDDAHANAYLIADNRLTELGGWDSPLLLEVLADASAIDGLLEATGFTAADLERLIAEAGPEALAEPDDVPDVMDDGPWTCEVGDVWALGPHRLVVGDITDAERWEALMAGDGPIGAVWTDPPYGVSYVGGTGMTVANDDLTGENLRDLLRGSLGPALARCAPGAPWWVAAPAGRQFIDFAVVLGRDLQVWQQMLVWIKDQFVLSRSDFHGRHEYLFYGWAPGAPGPVLPGDAQSVWMVPRPKRSEEHPTMKPVELITRALEQGTVRGALVADPFGGSGSTLIGCHLTGRVGRVAELLPKYADVICRRYQRMTGVLPVRDGQPVDFGVAAPEATAA